MHETSSEAGVVGACDRATALRLDADLRTFTRLKKRERMSKEWVRSDEAGLRVVGDRAWSIALEVGEEER